MKEKKHYLWHRLGCFQLHNDYYPCSTESPMCLAYVSWTIGDILDLEFSELIKPKGFGYRFGFNGKEQDSEVSGQGNTIAFEARIYDSRLGRFFSRDPREGEYAWQSTYVYFKNSPISTLDVLGMGGGKGKPKYHTVTKGETPLGIAKQYDLSIGTLASDNMNLNNGNIGYFVNPDGISFGSYANPLNGFFLIVPGDQLIIGWEEETDESKSDNSNSSSSEENSGENSGAGWSTPIALLGDGLSLMSKAINPSNHVVLSLRNYKYYNTMPKPGDLYGYMGGNGVGSLKEAKLKGELYKKFGRYVGAIALITRAVEFAYDVNQPGIGPNEKNFLLHRFIIDEAVTILGFTSWQGAVFDITYNMGYVAESLCNCNLQLNPLTRNFTPMEKTVKKLDASGANLHLYWDAFR